MILSSRNVGVAVLGFAIVSFVVLMALGLLHKQSITGMSGYTRVNKLAPELVMNRFGGGQFDLYEHRGRPTVINFWASWCPPCRQEAPILERVWRSYRDQGVLFVGVDTLESYEDGLSYLKEFDITYPNGLDHDGKITVDYGVIGLPVTFLVNKDGIVERRWVGAVSESLLVTWIDELVARSDPSDDGELDNLQSFSGLKQIIER